VPLIDLTMPAGALDAETRAGLVDRLGETLLRWEGAPLTEFFKSIMWVHVHELPADAVNAAGRPVAEPHFRIDVTVPEGALSQRRKEGAVKELTEAVTEAAGIDPGDALRRVWILVREVPEGNWGAGGEVVRFAQLRELADREREQAPAHAGD
jgi:phenylpyruvate tautomerase PptA (4-oxalocrotonate tautomerase family)